MSATTGAIGGKVLYLLFIWLVSAAGAAWLSERKGYTERVGLTFGLVLTFVGFFIVLLLPARPGSTWKREGPLPRRRRPGAMSEPALLGPALLGPPLSAPDAGAPAVSRTFDGPAPNPPAPNPPAPNPPAPNPPAPNPPAPDVPPPDAAA